MDHGIAGGLGAQLSMLLLYPLDLLRTIRQVESDRSGVMELFRNKGLSGMYHGLVPTLQTLGISYFVYFFAYNICKRSLHGLEKCNVALLDLVAASLAGVVNVLLTSPLWVVSTRMKLDANRNFKTYERGLGSEIVVVAQNEGLSALWSGCTSSLLLVSNPVIQFCIYDFLKRLVAKKRAITSQEAFWSGAMSKFVATILTYPLQVSQSRQRSESLNNAPSQLYAMYEEKGIRGLFPGIESKLLQTTLNAAILFVCYERIFRTIQTAKRIVQGKACEV